MSLEINRKFRERLSSGGALLLPGAANALAARIIEDLGFEAVYLSTRRRSATPWNCPSS